METLLALASFTFVASITPGPNNLMLAASGVGFGLRRTVPHMLGVCVGFAVLVLTCGLGIGAVIMQSPAAATALKVAGSGYLVFLAWTLRGNVVGPAPAGADGAVRGGRARPMSFAAAALALLCLVVTLVNAPCITSWAVLGSTIRAQLENPVWQRRFSGVMVVLTLYAAASIWL